MIETSEIGHTLKILFMLYFSITVNNLLKIFYITFYGIILNVHVSVVLIIRSTED